MPLISPLMPVPNNDKIQLLMKKNKADVMQQRLDRNMSNTRQ